MSIFKQLQNKDIKRRVRENQLSSLFGGTDPLLAKTGDGWSKTKNYSYTDDPLVTGSVYFVEDNSFYVTYADESQADEDRFLGWNSIMSTVGAKWDSTNQQYDYFISGSASTRVTEVIAISFNPDKYNDSIDYDNFYVSLSGSAGDEYTGISGSNYDVAESLVLAPYYLKGSIKSDSPNTDSDDDSGGNSDYTSLLAPAYELRTTTSNSFLSYDASSKAIDIDWTLGTLSEPMGVVYPEVGLILLFPQLFGRTQITDVIRTGDRSLNSLNSIMDINGYAIKRVEKTIVFSRLYSEEGNYTTNPTAFEKSGDYNKYIDDLIREPKAFITKIGFYNRQNECLAVSHLSNPIEKNDWEERSFKIEIEN